MYNDLQCISFVYDLFCIWSDSRLVANFVVNKIDIWRVRYHFSCRCVTIVTSVPALHHQLWHHYQHVKRPYEAPRRCAKIVFFIVIYGIIRSFENIIMYVPPWRTVCALSWGLFLCKFPSLFRNSGNKHPITLSWAHKGFATPAHTCPLYIPGDIQS